LSHAGKARGGGTLSKARLSRRVFNKHLGRTFLSVWLAELGYDIDLQITVQHGSADTVVRAMNARFQWENAVFRGMPAPRPLELTDYQKNWHS